MSGIRGISKRIRRRPAPRQRERTLAAGTHLGLNLVLAGIVFFSPAMVMVLGDRNPRTETDAWLMSSALEASDHSRSGDSSALSAFDERTFLYHVDSRLPRYLPHFQREARRHHIPWTLLAAQAYQESHWNPLAKSPTGVRGIMMLTKSTSSSLGVRSRLDPVQSIRGGAQHFAQLLRRLPPQIKEHDRIWFALAAYNVGRGHVMDARGLAHRLGKDPNRWADLREVLPLLARKEFYRTLRHGYARGWEPVQYVRRIQGYWSLFHHHYQDNPRSLRSKL